MSYSKIGDKGRCDREGAEEVPLGYYKFFSLYSGSSGSVKELS